MFSVLSLLKFLFFTCVFFKNLALAEDVNHFIYHGFNETSLQLGESAKIDPKYGLLELTNISYQQIGRAFFPTPFKFNKSFSFSTTFVFAIVPGMPDLGGHGFMFVISPSVNFPGALPVEWLGIFNRETNGRNSDHVFGIEFDTIKTVAFQDIDDNHVGIDIDSLISNVSAPAAHFEGKENKSFRLISGNPIQAWIDYDDEDKFINVTIAPLTSKKPKRPLLSTTIDLSSIMLDSMYVGFSSSTGSISSHHYILGWSFNTSGPAENLDISKLPPIPLLWMADTIRLLFLICFHLFFIPLTLAQHVSQFIYNGFQEANLPLNGIANIHPNGLLQLTNTSKQEMGYAYYPFPLNFRKNSSTPAQYLIFFYYLFICYGPRARKS